MTISNINRGYGSRLTAAVTTILFVALSLLASGPHPFDDDLARAGGRVQTVSASSGMSGVPCPLCDWAAHAFVHPAIVLAVVPAPAVEFLHHNRVELDAPSSAPAQPVGRAPPVRFV